jgi:hypothetical protein
MKWQCFDGVDDATVKFVTDELKKRSLNPELFKIITY